jgi:hypothetical protein
MNRKRVLDLKYVTDPRNEKAKRPSKAEKHQFALDFFRREAW